MKKIAGFILFFISNISYGQVGIGTNSPNSSAKLEISSSNSGLLIPRMSEANKLAISSPATGLMIFQTDGTAGFYYYSGSGWKLVGSDNFITNGTDPQPASFNITGTGVIGQDLVINGINFGKGGSSVTSNTISGYRSLIYNTIGFANTAGGFYALANNTTGSYNSAFGAQSMYSNTTGAKNVGIGFDALISNTIGVENTALGTHSLYSNTDGNDNTAVGFNSLNLNTTGNNNCVLGSAALFNNLTGWGNVSIGAYSASTLTSGSDNILIGYNSNVSANNLFNSIAIGANSVVSASNTVQLGNSNITDVYSTGVFHGASFSSTSDIRLKKNITPLSNAIQTVMKLNPVHYNKRSNLTSNEYNIDENGFIAQEIGRIMPNAVTATSDSDKLLSINYISIIPVLTKAIQEQQTEIDLLKQEIKILKERK